MHSSAKPSVASHRCAAIPAGKQHAPSPALTSRNGRPPSPICATPIASLTTICTNTPKRPARVGSPITLTPPWPKPWRLVPTEPSTASVWGRRKRSGLRASAVAWTAWRASATILACASCCNRRRKAMQAGSCGARIAPHPHRLDRSSGAAWSA
jgi:hypothetical protein